MNFSSKPGQVNSIYSIQQRARTLFLFLIFLLIVLIITDIYWLNSTSYIDNQIINPINEYLIQQTPTNTPTPKKIQNNPTSTKTFIPSQTPTNIPSKTIQPAAPCYRYTVTHLDESTSNLCYSLPDYNQLKNLGYQLNSAKTFYEFHLEGVQDYQDQYEITGSDIYLTAKESSQKKADREKEKYEQIILQMQNIETRGY